MIDRRPSATSGLGEGLLYALDFEPGWPARAIGAPVRVARGVGNSGTTGTYFEPQRFGWAVRFSDAGTGTVVSKIATIGDAAGSGGPSGNVFTLAFMVNLAASPNGVLYEAAINGGICVRISSNVLQLLASNSANLGSASRLPTVGAWEPVVITFDSRIVRFRIGGREAGSNDSGSTRTFSKGQCRFAGSFGGDTLRNDTRIGAFHVWDRELSPGEADAWAADPTQLLRRRRRRFPFASAAPALPTLTALNASMLTQTGARLTVSA